MPANASFETFKLPPLDRPRPHGLRHFAARVRSLAARVAAVGRRGASALRVATGRAEPDDHENVAGRAAGVASPAAPMAGETQWGRATERLVTGNRQADDARRFHFSATDQLDAAAYEMRMLMKALAPVVEAGLPAAATAEVVRLAEPQQPAQAPVVAAKVEKRAKTRKKARAAAAA